MKQRDGKVRTLKLVLAPNPQLDIIFFILRKYISTLRRNEHVLVTISNEKQTRASRVNILAPELFF